MMVHPFWDRKWQQIRRDIPDPATQVIAFVRWASPSDREEPEAVRYILSKILKDWRDPNGRPTETECVR